MRKKTVLIRPREYNLLSWKSFAISSQKQQELHSAVWNIAGHKRTTNKRGKQKQQQKQKQKQPLCKHVFYFLPFDHRSAVIPSGVLFQQMN